MKFNTPLPQPLPKECLKAANIFASFVDSANNGLDGIIPRPVLENARGFAIFTVFKAGFVLSARAGSGVVIAKLDDGSWSAPSAIGIGGMGIGGQLGAEVTDFLVVLNSRSAIMSFMSAGSFTLGGNMSIAVGPLGRNGEASGSVNTSGTVAAMYSYSKTRGLFGGVSIEGSVIMERQDANALAYTSDVTAQKLLGGVISPPEWALPLIKTLEALTGMPGGHKWIHEDPADMDFSYAFDPSTSTKKNSRAQIIPSSLKKRGLSTPFPPTSWGIRKNSGSYFTTEESGTVASKASTALSSGTAGGFPMQFDSDFIPDEHRRHRSTLSSPLPRTSYNTESPYKVSSFDSSQSNGDMASNTRSFSTSSYTPLSRTNPFIPSLPSSSSQPENVRDTAYISSPKDGPGRYIMPKAGLASPLSPQEGIGRAVALYDFEAVESGDLSFKKGQVVTIVEKSDSSDDWWKGKLEGREGIFPANFVEVV